MNLSLVLRDLIVVGAGPAGIMAAIRAGQLKKDVLLVERNTSIGRKILLTGKGRCNITNTASIDVFVEKFAASGQFLRSAFYAFSNDDLIDFFKRRGLSMKVERQGRVFPQTQDAASVVGILKEALSENGVDVLYNSRVMEIKREDGIFNLGIDGGSEIRAKRVILATGGASYKKTGSTGDGFHIAKNLGHKFISLRPGLVPLTVKEKWVRDLQGLTLKNIRINFKCNDKKITSHIGELLFTHFGVSGPLVLDLSAEVVNLLSKEKGVELLIDLKPALTPEQLKRRLLREIEERGAINIKNMLKGLLPLKMISVFTGLIRLDADKKINQLSQEERRSIIGLLKNFRLTINGSLPLEEAMITCGGIPTKDINPRTMESRIVPGFYFAGEVIDACAPSGGYNLQEAFSTGYLAGESAANA